MSENAADKVREAGKVQNDPALAAIQGLGDSVAESFAHIERTTKAQIGEVSSSVAETRKDLEATRTQLEASTKFMQDKHNALERRYIALSGGARDIEGCALASFSDEDKKVIPIMEWMISSTRRSPERYPLLSNAVGSALVANWMLVSYRLQKQRFSNHQEQAELFRRKEQYEKAFCEAFRIEKAAGFLTTTDTLGGHWLPEPVQNELYRLILDHSVIGGLATHVPMTTKTLDLPVEGSSALSVSWGTEATTITDSVPASNATNKVTLTAARINGRATSSIEELQDSAISILQWVQTKLVEMCGRELDSQALEGTGSPFTGIVAASGVNAVTPGTNGTAIDYAGLVAMVYKARERASRVGARWFFSPEVMAKVIGLVDTYGMPIVQYSNVPNQIAGTILGYPVEVHSVISSSRTWGTGTSLSNAYFGPPSAIVFGDRMGMSWDVSDIPGFTTAEVHMRLLARVAIGVAVPAAWTRNPRLATL